MYTLRLDKCPGESVLINAQLPHLFVLAVTLTGGGLKTNIDGKLVDFNDMVIVIVKCFDYNWMNGSESD